MADLATNVRPGRSHQRVRAGLVHDGGSWVGEHELRQRPFDAATPRIAHSVPEGLDPARPKDWREYEGAPELGDGLGGFLRAAPMLSAAEQAADDEYLLAGEQLWRSTDGRFGVAPLEEEHQAARRRRLLSTLREHELEEGWR